MSSIVYAPEVNRLEVLGRDMKITMLWFDSTKLVDTRNCRDLLGFIYDFPEWTWVRPAWRAPWHWYTALETPMGYTATLNIWPHKAKWQMEGFKAEDGWDRMRSQFRHRLAAIDGPLPADKGSLTPPE